MKHKRACPPQRTVLEREQLLLEATEEQLQGIRRRLGWCAHLAMKSEGGQAAFWKLFPQAKAAIDALPDLGPLSMSVAELRPVVLDALRAEGITVTREHYDHFGYGWLWEEEPVPLIRYPPVDPPKR